MRRPPRRPRNNRIKGREEVTGPKKAQNRCSKCGEIGHNKKTCKGAPAVDTKGRKGNTLALL